jgi:hypothetical protein
MSALAKLAPSAGKTAPAKTSAKAAAPPARAAKKPVAKPAKAKA